MLREPLLALDRVSKRFARGTSAVQALAELSLALEGGEVVLLLGANGAGKSTLLRLIAGLIEPSSGAIRIDGRAQLGAAGALQREIGWCSSDERSFYPRLSVRENLRLFGALHGLDRRTIDERIRARAEVFGLASVLDRAVQRCSTGERQKLNLIRALLHEPRIVLLDEPMRSLDSNSRATLVRVLSEIAADRDRLVLIASHDFEGLDTVAQRVVILDAGHEVLAGSMREIATNLGSATWQVTFSSTAARDRALAGYPFLRADSAGELAVSPAPHGEMPAELAACVREHARDIERIERRVGPSLGGLLSQIARGEPIESAREASSAGAASAHGAQASHAMQAPHTRASWSREHDADAQRSREPDADAARNGARRRPSALRVLGALARRDRLVYTSYRFQIGLRAGVLVAWVLSLHFVAELVDKGSPKVMRLLSGDYFIYVLLGIAFLRISQVALVQMASALREEQLQGTVEPLIATGRPSWLLLVGGLVWPLASEITGLALIFGAGAEMLGADLSAMNIPAFLLAAAAIVVAMIEWGLLSAAFTIAFKRGDPVALFINLISIGLSGVYFPIELLPTWLQPVSYVLPLTWGLDAVRAAVMHGVGLESPEYMRALLSLAALIVLLAPVSLWCQRRAFAYARRCGSLTQV